MVKGPPPPCPPPDRYGSAQRRHDAMDIVERFALLAGGLLLGFGFGLLAVVGFHG